MKTMRRALPASLVLLAVAVPAASAATVEVVTQECDARYAAECSRFLRFVAAPGERNDVVLTAIAADREVRVRDAGTPLRAGAGCRQTGSDAICSSALPEIELGDGDDTLLLEIDLPSKVSGGDGNDRLTGGPVADQLAGGTGTDELHGGDGGDVLLDGDAAEGRDVFDGGPGSDVVSYAGRETAVAVRLARRSGGGATEGDQLVDVEGATGGDGEDRIVGDALGNDLDGGGGRDRLSGRGGDDRLQGGRQTDQLRGGDGDDKLIGTVDSGEEIPRLKRGQDFLWCGSGKDIVERADLDDIIVSGCEGVEPEQGLFLLEHPLRPVLNPRALTSPIIRIANAVHDGRRVILRVREPFKGGRLLGSTVVTRDGAGQKSVRLNALGRALLARRTSMRVGVEAFERGGDRDEIARFRMVLRRPAGG